MRDLNADHILEIFKHLNIHDLAAIAEAADWCKVLAKDSFTRHHQNSLDLQFSDREQFERCLKMFGKMATSVKISLKPNQENVDSMVVLEMFAKYCCEKAESLTLDGFCIDLSTCVDNAKKLEICRLMCKLKVLNIFNGDLICADSLFGFCDKALETINLQHVSMCKKTVNSFLREYSKLHTFMLDDSVKRQSITNAHIIKLLELNPNIRKLKLRLKLMRSIAADRLLNVVSSLPELTNLTIRVANSDRVDNLAHIPKLQRLKLGYKGSLTGLIEALATKSSLNHLELCDVQADLNLFQQLSRNENLQILKLTRMRCIEHLPYIAANFKNLLELHVLDSQLTRQTLSGDLLTPFVTQMESLRILNVQLSNARYWCIDYNAIVEICAQRTIQSNLLVFWANDFRRASRAINRDNISIVFPCNGVASGDFDYDFSDNEEEFPEMYKRVQRIVRRNQVVRIKNSSKLLNEA